MFKIKKCSCCGAKAFSILVDTKIHVACTSCGEVFNDTGSLSEEPLNANFKLRLV